MQLSGLLAPGRGPKAPAVELDLFPAVDETALASRPDSCMMQMPERP